MEPGEPGEAVDHGHGIGLLDSHHAGVHGSIWSNSLGRAQRSKGHILSCWQKKSPRMADDVHVSM